MGGPSGGQARQSKVGKVEAGPWPWAHASCLQVEVEEVHSS